MGNGIYLAHTKLIIGVIRRQALCQWTFWALLIDMHFCQVQYQRSSKMEMDTVLK